MSVATLHFTSSDAFLEADAHARESADIEIHDYIEATYDGLRHAEGEHVAFFIDGAWELADQFSGGERMRFSDWAVAV